MTPHTTRLHRFLPLLLTCLIAPVQAAFTDNGDGTVTDTVTGLMWDQCSWGQIWVPGSGPGNRSCTGTASTQNWAASLALANTANTAQHRGRNDWRLPNRTELVSLVNYATWTAGQPVIDGAAFPNTLPSAFWSSTVYAPDPAVVAWVVYFNNGNTFANLQASNRHVRLVRSGQSFGAFDGYSGSPGPLLTVTNTVGGKITSDPAGIDCGNVCSVSFNAGVSVILTATPAAGYLFAGWTGACQGTSTVCAVQMDATKAVQAQFVINYFLIKGRRYQP